ncbi:MAG TPA: alpha/beta hydrolase [Thermoanaerobaculia bacterium]|nr:alpha/beta hydrolase [Thermoanaerobaculia bacterium]
MNQIEFESSGDELVAFEEGTGESVVMLHGFMANHVAAAPYVASLLPHYRVVLPDLRGSGASHSSSELTFDQLADDLAALLDHLDVDQAAIGGVSSGSGVAVRFALTHPERVSALVLVHPVYAGAAIGYTQAQQDAFTGMDALARRAPAEGIEVMKPLYATLPEPIRARALAMLQGFGPESVAATSHFLVSGAQPFENPSGLGSITIPTLLIQGDDSLHPAETSASYAENLPNCLVTEGTSPGDIGEKILGFCESMG